MSRAALVIAAAYGAYLLYAFGSGALYFYIHPVYVIPTLLTGLILLALAILAARAPGASSPHAAPSPPAIVALALPLALGFLLPPQPLSPVAAAQRGVETASIGRVEAPADWSVGRRPETYTIKDWVKAFQADPEPSRHAGTPVRVSGFVYRDERLPRDWFLVSRFVVQCCAVDAQPIGLPVRVAGGAPPEAGRWVAVEGVWEVAEAGGQRRAVIAPTAVTPIARPDQPYLY